MQNFFDVDLNAEELSAKRTVSDVLLDKLTHKICLCTNDTLM